MFLLLLFLIDINECLLNIDRCAHNCVNTNGSYSCGCESGYRLRADGHSCEGLLETCTHFSSVINHPHGQFTQTSMNAYSILMIVIIFVLTMLEHINALVFLGTDWFRINTRVKVITVDLYNYQRVIIYG